jgi:hypothetical protein
MKLQIKPTIESLLEALSRGRVAIKDAAAIMVSLVDADPRVYGKIIKEDPRISLNLLVTLEKVGRGVIYDALIFDSSPGARRLLALPYSKQKEYYENPIKIVQLQKGKPVQVEKQIFNLTPAEAKIVFNGNDLRPLNEQADILNQSNKPVMRAEPAQRYDIDDDGALIVHFSETKFTLSQLEEILESCKTKAIRSLATK